MKRKQIQTVVSFDDGGSWTPLSAPSNVDCKSLNLDSKDCVLNLHSRTDSGVRGPIFSAKSSPGLMLGVGNVGKHLLDYNDGDTFLTRDAGRTWTLVRQGAHLYEFGDHGGLLVSARSICFFFI
jgi:hypothetical protein